MSRIHGFAIVSAAWVLIFVGLGVLADLRSELGGDYDSQLFYGQLSGDLLDDYEGVVVVAHNSGNRRYSSRLAQDAGVPIIEIDVRTIDGRLYAAHSPPARFVGHYFTRSIPLSSAWSASSDSPAIILDLKDSSDTFLKRLFAFLEPRQDDDRVLIISSRSEYALAAAREALPNATLLLSVATWGQLDLVQTDEQLAATIDGVTVRAALLEEEEDVNLLKDKGLIIYAWVVNDLSQLNRLVSWGVDGVTTDNLAIIELLSPDLDDDIEKAEEEAEEARQDDMRP